MSLECMNTLPFEEFSQVLAYCIDRLNDAIVITEADSVMPGPKIVWANKIFYERNGYTAEEVIGKSPRILQGPLTCQDELDKVRVALKTWQSVRIETVNYRKDGSTYWNEFELNPITKDDGWVTHWVSVQRDVTERKNLELKFKAMVATDYLTQVLMRRNFMEKLEDEFERLRRGYHPCFALLLFDLDFFKQINDSFGHAGGDAVLQDFSAILRSHTRKLDNVGRLGGEEFSVVMPSTNASAAHMLAEKIRLAVKKSVAHYKDHAIHYTVSIGVFIATATTPSIEEAMDKADKALYQAKTLGRDRVVVAQS